MSGRRACQESSLGCCPIAPPQSARRAPRIGPTGFPSVVSKHLRSHFSVTAHRAPAGYYPVGAYRNINDGRFVVPATAGQAWASNRSGVNSRNLLADASSVVPSDTSSSGHGMHVRCLQAFALAIFHFPTIPKGAEFLLSLPDKIGSVAQLDRAAAF